MKFFMLFFVCEISNLSSAQTSDEFTKLKMRSHNAFGYFGKIGISEAERIYEEENSKLFMPRIVGGEVADIFQYNYQAGLLISFKNLTGTGVCGGALISANRVATAAHCWDDGLYQGTCMTVILGSEKLFSGGTRIRTCDVKTHPGWEPSLAMNDVAVVYLPSRVTFSDSIAPIALPLKSDIYKNLVGEAVVASGYGKTGEYIPVSDDQVLSKLNLVVISNEECLRTYPAVIGPSNICTGNDGASGNVAICSGDSGGPLVHKRNGTKYLVGIASFGSPAGCDSNLPNGYSRVSYFLKFFKKHMYGHKTQTDS